MHQVKYHLLYESTTYKVVYFNWGLLYNTSMIRQILLYESDTISVYCSPAVSQSSNRALRTYVKAAIAAEKTLIKDIKKKYPKTTKNIKFNFHYKNYKAEDMLGSCDVETDDDIRIDLNAKMIGSSICKTIAHELVHARQFISGQLKYNVHTKYFSWEGDKHRYIYRKQPWELEAYKLQERGNLKMKRWLLDHVHYQPTLKTRDL